MPLNLKQRLSAFLSQTGQYETFALPLLPIHSVLFPGGRLTLKVFEARYVELANACIADNTPIGLCLIRDDIKTGMAAQPERVGCLVEIAGWEKLTGDMLSIDVHGKQRFHVDRLERGNDGRWLARATLISQEPRQSLPRKHRACAVALRRMIEHLGVAYFAQPLLFEDAVWVGYRLAELLPLKASARQDMLEMNDSLVRIEILHNFLSRQGLAG